MKTNSSIKHFLTLMVCVCMFATSYSRETRGNVNGHIWVDLGLPSGVLWATCNIGANAIEEHGTFFAWGEISPKQEYNYDNSTTTDMNPGNISGNAKYDAAKANWGDEWRIPTRKEFQELIDNCTWKQVNFNGEEGIEATSKINNMRLFFPAAGQHIGDIISSVGIGGSYWSATPTSYENEAFLMQFGSKTPTLVQALFLCGNSIRPVIDPINDPYDSVIYEELSELSIDDIFELFDITWVADEVGREEALQELINTLMLDDKIFDNKIVSFVLLDKAVKENLQWAYSEYGKWYFFGREKGYPVNRDAKKARKYFELVYPKTPELEYLTGLSYEEESDFEMAIYYFNKASEKGYSEATDRLSKTIDSLQSFDIYPVDDQTLNALAHYLLARCNIEGYGMAKNFTRGAEYLIKAAEEGNMDAQGELGDLYFRGKGVEKSFEMGLYWWQKCADSGSGEAKSELKKLFNRLLKNNDKTPIEKYQLGYCYYFGYGTEIDITKAFLYMREAADEGCVEAENFIREYGA